MKSPRLDLTLLLLVANCRSTLESTHVARQTQLTDVDRREALDAHNHFRSIVNPTATNMLRLDWHNELAQIAQNYSNLCIFDHNAARTDQQVTLNFDYIGENIAITSSSGSNYTELIETWYNEHRDYDYSTNSCSSVCGHYVQVVWANTLLVGCGARRCSLAQGFPIENSLLLVCNYAPGSDSQRPYEAGQPCTACPPAYTLCWENLCTQQHQAPTSVGGTIPDDANHLNPSPVITFLTCTLMMSVLL